MRLADLAAAAEGVRIRAAGPDRDPDVNAVVHDTRAVADGALFCCVRGSHTDGHDLAPAAVAAGATALLVDHELPLDVPQLVVDDVRAALGPLADAFWDHPSRHLDVLGVTGTSGKTTVTHLLAAVFAAAGRPCGVIGTLSGARTTPEAPELQALLAEHRRGGDAAVAMEVSSHGLDQGRVASTRFAAALFTNLSQDHLDYHGTMEAYFRAKARLFRPEYTSDAVVCVDEPWGRRLADEVSAAGQVRLHRYSLADAADVRLTPRRGDVPLAGPGRDAGAGRTVQRPQRRRGGHHGGGRRVGAGRHRPGPVAGRPGPGALRGGRRRPAVHGPRRLRPQARCPRPGAARRPRAGDRVGPADRGVRVRWRPRPGQASGDGRGGGPPRRPHDRHLRQPPLRGSRRHHRRDRGGRPRRCRPPIGSTFSPTGAPPSNGR